MNNPLIYGKNELTNIVSIEQGDSTVEIFRQINGEVVSEFHNSKHWLLSHYTYNDGWARLKGNLHYKYGKQFESKEQWEEEKRRCYRHDGYIVHDEKEQCMINKGYTYFKGMDIKDISVLSFDLETTTLDPKLPEAKILLISTTYRKQNEIIKKLFSYDEYENQGGLIEDFCKWVLDCNPSCICGHNIFGFDLNYLHTIASKAGVNLTLGRDGSEAKFNEYESKFRKEGGQFIHYHKVKIYGREIVDTMFLAIRYDVSTRKYNSYGLKNIINQESLEKPNRTFYDANQIRFNYHIPAEFEKIKRYCEDDSDDSLALFDLMIKPFFYLAQSIPKSFQELLCSASGSQLNSMMVRAYLQQGHSIPKASQGKEFVGAISLGNPGIYKNCLKWDINSLYPSIMLQYEIYDREKDPNGYMIEILRIFTIERLKNKKLAKETKSEYYDNLQNMQKIVINSLYGFLGTEGINFNYPRGAAEVTRYGREILEKSIEWATGKKLELKDEN